MAVIYKNTGSTTGLVAIITLEINLGVLVALVVVVVDSDVYMLTL